jgi:hypothetical protein
MCRMELDRQSLVLNSTGWAERATPLSILEGEKTIARHCTKREGALC